MAPRRRVSEECKVDQECFRLENKAGLRQIAKDAAHAGTIAELSGKRIENVVVGA